MLAGYVYLFGAAYVVAPLAGMHIESASLAAGMAALPFAAKLAIKGMLAVPFAFHALNGVRHLIWDTGRQLTIDGVYRTGYVVLGLSSVSSIYLMFFA
jgi:succinate dehydrogenase (ubiquinone) cytochrome b560 subunit